MNAGKTLFAQLMEFVPWTSFSRIVARYAGDSRAMALPCTEHFRIMPTRNSPGENLCAISKQHWARTRPSCMGWDNAQAVRRSTLADANERRDWRIWSDLATLLIRRARKLYAQEDWDWT